MKKQPPSNLNPSTEQSEDQARAPIIMPVRGDLTGQIIFPIIANAACEPGLQYHYRKTGLRGTTSVCTDPPGGVETGPYADERTKIGKLVAAGHGIYCACKMVAQQARCACTMAEMEKSHRWQEIGVEINELLATLEKTVGRLDVLSNELVHTFPDLPSYWRHGMSASLYELQAGMHRYCIAASSAINELKDREQEQRNILRALSGCCLKCGAPNECLDWHTGAGNNYSTCRRCGYAMGMKDNQLVGYPPSIQPLRKMEPPWEPVGHLRSCAMNRDSSLKCSCGYHLQKGQTP